MSDYFKHAARMEAQREAEAAGQVADSLEVRMKLMKRVHAGEITLEEAQAELKEIKSGARKAGQVTRAQAYRGELP